MLIEQKSSPHVAYRSLQQIARRLPPNKENRPVHPSTITRWIVSGVRLADGTSLKLRAVRFPAGWRTTDEWVNSFLEALTGASRREPVVAPQSTIRSPSERSRSHAKAKKRLKASGF